MDPRGAGSGRSLPTPDGPWILPDSAAATGSFTLDALVIAYAELRMALARPGSSAIVRGLSKEFNGAD